MKYGIVELNMSFFLQLLNTLLLLIFFVIVFIGIPYYMIKRLKNTNDINKRLEVIEMKIDKLENQKNELL